jgi:hypothetical protein
LAFDLLGIYKYSQINDELAEITTKNLSGMIKKMIGREGF